MSERSADEIRQFLRDAGVSGDAQVVCTPLEGGVSSDIWKATWDGGVACVKRALARLKVRARWTAPVERNRYEVAWMRTAEALSPGCVPRVLAHDPARGMFAMSYLAPQQHPLWKATLRDGHADPAFAARVGAVLARIHAGTAGDSQVARAFATDRVFHDIRLEPYLLATARAHPDRAPALERLAAVTACTRLALVHGDVSPKNILEAPDGGPVFLDAECAWYGDPAFDLAFCLNHLLLKCLWTPRARDGFLACFASLAGAYLPAVGWESPAELEARAAALLPGLMLARVDGKSPVEYLTRDAQRDTVREVARQLLAQSPQHLHQVATAWRNRLEAR